MSTGKSSNTLSCRLYDFCTVLVTPVNYALHVVRKDILRHAHVAEGVDHTNEQIFLLCVWEELHIPLSAVVANHSEAGGIVLASVISLYFREASVHLKRLSGASRVTASTVPLRLNCMTRGRNKMLVGSNIVLDDGFPASEPVLAELDKAHNRVYNASFEQSIQNAGIPAQERGRGFAAFQGVLDVLKVMLFHASQFGAGNASSTAQVCKVDFLHGELVSLFNHHLLYDLRHRWIHG